MNPAAPQPEQATPSPWGEIRPMGPGDLERMMAESDERWRNRPRPIQTENDNGLRPEELRVCRLPNNGVSEGVRAQLERNRQRREAEQREKAQKDGTEL
ncbi:hypothetical protein NESM_000358400 [Novymonas esmeraldas]|uniref:Uncharacterized protein n=1 Tax=Novymonas esmeraldas TaxID=1808958 RepID=A0AAW0END8_9TRYP